MYKYFVAFSFIENGLEGQGCVFLDISRRITDISDLDYVISQIKEKGKVKAEADVVPTNFFLINGDELEESDRARRRSRDEEESTYLSALREIDQHIRSTITPVQNIIDTLKKTLPEYKENEVVP